MINTIKDIAIIADFILSIVAASVKSSKPQLSNTLFNASAIVLLVAVMCAIISIVFKKRKNR